MTNKLALIVAVILGSLSIVLIYKRIEGIKKEYADSAQLIPVLVASRTIAAGSPVSAGDVGTIDVPNQALQALSKAYYPAADRNLVENRKVVFEVKQGQIFQPYHFEAAAARRGGARLPPNLRAITVNVNATNALAGMLRPGDSIDIITTSEYGYQSGATIGATNKERIKVTRTLLRKVPVIATDNVTDAASAYADYSTITLGLPPDDVIRFYHAQDSGSQIHFIKTDDASGGAAPKIQIPDMEFDEVKAEIDRYFQSKNR